MAGLTCAVRLQELGVAALVVEAGDEAGGRIRTDEQDGFLLDRGFQVLLTAYPETRRLLNLDALGLEDFHAGALVRMGGGFTRLGDPLRDWRDLLPTVLSGVGTLQDKLSVLRLRRRVTGPSLERVLARPELTTQERLRELGFSDGMVQRFFRPFLGGIFLETELATSSRKFEFVFRMFSQGTAALPRGGMQEIPRQLAARLSVGQVRFGQRVLKVRDSEIVLESGEIVAARQVVIATDFQIAAQLRGQNSVMPSAKVACLYFAAGRSPNEGRWLVLNGDGTGPINNLCIPSDLQPGYAPTGQSLVSVTVLERDYVGREDLVEQVRAQLVEWYGAEANEWRHLRTYTIPQAVALQAPPALTPVEKPARVNEWLVQCGDYADIVSIEGAVKSGMRAAEEVFRQLQ